MEDMLATNCDTLNCSDYDSALSIITMLSGDQANLTKLKEDLDAEKKLSAKLKEDLAWLEADKSRLLRRNGDLEANFKTNENDLNREIRTLKEDLDKEK